MRVSGAALAAIEQAVFALDGISTDTELRSGDSTQIYER
jgi:hypothetical protein